MENISPAAQIPFLRSCKQESDVPIDGEVKGNIPKWLRGNLIRNGSGLLEIGPDRYYHLFDGMALMHKFSFRDGHVQYQSKFLRSDAYKKNTKANRILQTEFGTRGVPDPCMTIFQRFASRFKLDDSTDNDLVNIIVYGDEAYACSETTKIWRIDTDNLDSLEKVNLSHHLPVHHSIAHAHEDSDGTVYNMGSNFGYNCTYSILKFPPKANPQDPAFKGASEVCRFPAARKGNFSYYHSFAMTDNYFVFVEQPMFFSLSGLAWAQFFSGTFSQALHWESDTQCKIHVIKRSDGSLYDVKYASKGFFVFHHINAYEDDGHLVVDMCAYDNGDVIPNLYIKALTESVQNKNKTQMLFDSRAKRYVLPLNVDSGRRGDENLITLKETKATAYRQSDGSIYLNPEVLTSADWCPELPRINYEKYNGKKYKYFYAIAKLDSHHSTQHLIKVNTETKEITAWGENGVIPSEPVFIPDPNPENSNEDSGVLLASLLYNTDETKVSLLVLDATNMTEMGRVTFQTKSSVPGDFHGVFLTKE